MIALPANTRIRIAEGVTDMRRGFTGLSAQVQTALAAPIHNLGVPGSIYAEGCRNEEMRLRQGREVAVADKAQ